MPQFSVLLNPRYKVQLVTKQSKHHSLHQLIQPRRKSRVACKNSNWRSLPESTHPAHPSPAFPHNLTFCSTVEPIRCCRRSFLNSRIGICLLSLFPKRKYLTWFRVSSSASQTPCISKCRIWTSRELLGRLNYVRYNEYSASEARKYFCGP